MDRIVLESIVVHGRHGAYEEERQHSQPFHVDVVLHLDLSKAAQSDALDDTVDYAKVHATVVRIVEQTSFALLERLGAEILRAIFADARIAEAEVSIAKPNLLDGATARVVLRRANGAR